jgi:hypothetical protein
VANLAAEHNMDASFRNTKESALPFAKEVVVAIVVATERCAGLQ